MMIRIGKLNIRFETEEEAFDAFLREEYGLIAIPDEGEADITVRIIRGGELPGGMALRAAGREACLAMSGDLRSFTLSVPYKPVKKDAFMLMNPAFMPKWQACLTDFLHNPFLAAVEVKLLESGMTLYHASAVRRAGGAKLLLGTGGAGKSTVAGLLAKRGCGVIAEDFCVIGGGKAYPLPHRARLSIRKFDALNESAASDKLNRAVSRALGKKPVRILPFERIYAGAADASEYPIDGVYLLERGAGPSVEGMSKEYAAKTSAEIMQTEFSNMAWSKEVFARTEYKEDTLFTAVEKAVAAALEGASLYRLRLPVYDDLEMTASAAESLLFPQDEGREA